MLLFECPDCGALVINKTKHATSHTTYTLGNWKVIEIE